MSDWQTTTLGDLCREGGGGIQTGPFGSQLHASDYVLDGVPSVMPQNIGDNIIREEGIARIQESDAKRLSRYRMRKGDIVYSRRGDVEKRALVRDANEGWLCGTGCLRVRLGDNSIHDPAFLSYLLGTEESREWIVRHAVGATMANLNTSILSSVPLAVPEPTVQRAIAEVLGALDDKIAANTKLAITSEDLVAVHFQHAIDADSTTSRPLLEVIDVDFGEPFGGAEFAEPGTGRPLIRIRDLKTFTSQIWTTEIRSREILIQPGDVVVGMDAEFRPTVWLGQPGLLNQRVCRARGKSTGPAFVLETLMKPLRRIENYKTATTVIHLNKKDLERAEVLLPGPDRLAYFESSVEALYSQRISLAHENRTLTATRDALLPQLMSGKLRVKDAEKVLENAGV
jgi:type I restriction enzyme S subunit